MEQQQHPIQLDEAIKLDLLDAITEQYLRRTDKAEDLIGCARDLSLSTPEATFQSLPGIAYPNHAQLETQICTVE